MAPSLFGRDDEARPEGGDEGVRLIPPGEAAEAVERGAAVPRKGADQKKFGDRPEPPPADKKAAIRFPLDDATDPGEVERPRVVPVDRPSGEQPVVAFEPPSAETELPHWTADATGEVPRVVLGGDDDAEESERWAAFANSAPRWRDQTTDWNREEDHAGDLVHDDDTRLGALDDTDRPSQEAFLGFDDLEVPDAPPPTASREPIRIQSGGRRPIRPQGPGAPGRAAKPRPARAAAPDAPPAARASGRPLDAPAPADVGGDNGGGRDVKTAVVAGLGIAGVAIVLFLIGPVAAMLLVLAILTLAGIEFFNAMRRGGFKPAVPLGVAAVVASPLIAYNKGDNALPLVIFLTFVFGALWFLTGVGKGRVLANLAITVFGVAYVGVLGSYAALLLRGEPGPSTSQGISFLLLAVLAAVGDDVGGFFAGRRFGRRPLSEASPNKTVEGLLGGVAVSVLVVLVFGGLFGVGDLGFGRALVFGIACAIAGPLGDLTESLIKRDLGIKDMGTVIPGHGGLLDRFDSMLFVLPTAYYVLRAFGLA